MKLSNLKTLHDQGFALIILEPKSKKPYDFGWSKAAKASWEKIEKQFKPDDNMGVALGTQSRLANGKYLAVIDCDVKSKSDHHIAEMESALKKMGVNPTAAPTVTSGRGNGSKHIYVCSEKSFKPFRVAQSKQLVKVHMPSVKPSKRELEELSPSELKQGIRIRAAWEISLMGQGQQVVLPPSIHPDSGLAYRWASPFTAAKLFCLSEEKLLELAADRLDASSAHDHEAFQFEVTDYEIMDAPVSAKLIDMVISGAEVSDRSAALFTVSMALYRSGLETNDILTVLTDRNNYLGLVAYDHTKSTNRMRAARWVFEHTLKKAKAETNAARLFDDDAEIVEPLTDTEAKEQEDALKEDRGFPDLTQEGKLKSTLQNVLHAIEMHAGKGVIGYNVFANRITFLKDTPYGGKRGREVTDADDLALKVWCAKTFKFEPPTQICFEAHQTISKSFEFHPVRDWLRSLHWDGKPRLKDWLKKGFGADAPPEYMEAISTKVLVAAVKRVMEPGCKFDYTLVLEGEQGRGKSSALAALCGGDWFTDSIGDIYQKDAVDNMAGKWLIELGELASIKKADQDFLKSFLTRQVDRVRLPYGKRSADFPRQSIFIGTTNHSTYFQDETGNRRFWPISIKQADFAWLALNRNQLFAEAVDAYEMGEELYLSKEIELIARAQQEYRFDSDEWEMGVALFLVKTEKTAFTTTEVYKSLEGNEFSQPSESELRRMGKVLRRLNCEKKVRRINGVLGKAWVRKPGPELSFITQLSSKKSH
jgi:predicted P-loop ATPase